MNQERGGECGIWGNRSVFWEKKVLKGKVMLVLVFSEAIFILEYAKMS